MHRALTCVLTVLALSLAAALPASAQYSPPPEPAVGEQYVFEFGTFLWDPPPEVVVRTESVDILGDTIDLERDLGVERTKFPDFRAVLRPARKHKLRFSYVRIKYTAETVLTRTIVFNGTTYRIGAPVNSTFDWKAMRFGYEWDFISRTRGFVGVIAEVKYTDVSVDVLSLALDESASARIPIPSIGGTFRVYPARMVALTGEVTGIRLPGKLTDGDDTANYFDWDLSATVNFTNHVGAQVGYRSIDVNYRYNEEFGEFSLDGLYFGGLVRF